MFRSFGVVIELVISLGKDLIKFFILFGVFINILKWEMKVLLVILKFF